jgi:hypothetical protein
VRFESNGHGLGDIPAFPRSIDNVGMAVILNDFCCCRLAQDKAKQQKDRYTTKIGFVF